MRKIFQTVNNNLNVEAIVIMIASKKEKQSNCFWNHRAWFNNLLDLKHLYRHFRVSCELSTRAFILKTIIL